VSLIKFISIFSKGSLIFAQTNVNFLILSEAIPAIRSIFYNAETRYKRMPLLSGLKMVKIKHSKNKTNL